MQELKPIGTDQPQKIALLPVNRAKNRFTNILPYDKTRIKLMAGDEEDEGTDYINGNWMPVGLLLVLGITPSLHASRSFISAWYNTFTGSH